MKFYYSYNQLTTPKGFEDKKKFFKSNFLTAFTTIYPVFGVLIVFALTVVGNSLFSSNDWLEKSLLAALSGSLYFHFHCMGIQQLINQRNKF